MAEELKDHLWRVLRTASRPKFPNELLDTVCRQSRQEYSVEDAQTLLDKWVDSGFVRAQSRGVYLISPTGRELSAAPE